MSKYFVESARKQDGVAKDPESATVEVRNKKIVVQCHNTWKYIGLQQTANFGKPDYMGV